MIPVLSRAQMRAFDEHAIEKCHVPSLILMENAGRGAADAISKSFPGADANSRVVVLCGTGNNGGDGFVVARHLLGRGASVEAWLCGDVKKLTPDCKANHDAFKGIGGTVRALGKSLDPLVESVAVADVIVDGLFGTGLDRAIAGVLAEVIAIVAEGRKAGARVVALDVPSGLDTDTGMPLGSPAVCVRADMTVTFAHLKLGHMTGSGAVQAGTVHVVDIGVPAGLRADATAHLLEAADVRAVLPRRAIDTHKYRAGHVALLAGSPGKTGAALLAAQGALRGGAGAATVISTAAKVLEARLPEVMVVPLDPKDPKKLDEVLAKKAACLIGPGFGTDDAAKKIARHVLKTFEGPVVADADSFSLFAGDPTAFARKKKGDSKWVGAILTPHAGELGRLLGPVLGRDDVEEDRFASAREAATLTQAVVLLKGAYTIVASPDGRMVIAGEGTPALATAGSGDVLAGLITALACTLPPFEAAWAGAFLHGVAGAAWSKINGDRGLLAGEIAAELPGVLAALLAV